MIESGCASTNIFHLITAYMYLNSNVSPIHQQLRIKYSFDYQQTLITVQSKHLIYSIRNYKLLKWQEVWIFLPVFSYQEHARYSLETRWTNWRAEDQRMFKRSTQLLHLKRILYERNSLKHIGGRRESESAMTFNSAEVPLLRSEIFFIVLRFGSTDSVQRFMVT